MNPLEGKRHVYFIAIGGIGMSGLALVLLKKGYKVSGSDLKPNSLTDELKRQGAVVRNRHTPRNLAEDVDLVVYSSCIRSGNPELAEAARRRIPAVTRGAILAQLVSEKKGIAVCGCHGKTTTSAMIATLLADAGLDPTVLVGGEVNSLGSNARFGRGRHLVAEADESDGSFLKLRPVYSVVTNIDEDHMEYFKDTKGLIGRFQEYARNTKKEGCFIYCADDPRMPQIKKHCRSESMSFGFRGTADVSAENIISSARGMIFDCRWRRRKLGAFRISVPGMHNVSNALAAVCVGLKLKLTTHQINRGLEKYTGTKRRFQARGCFGGVTVVEDYAHHPTEIMATLRTAAGLKPKRIIGVFQPHRFTRTYYLADRFAGCFVLSDRLILTDVYAASENAIDGITGRTLHEKVVKSGHKNAEYIPKDMITDHICRIKKKGDMVVVLGAGDINSIADELVNRLR